MAAAAVAAAAVAWAAMCDCHADAVLAAVKGEAYCDYALTGMVIRSYTMEAFYVDHVGMIYHTKKEAWQAEKMEKRIVRYTTFFVAHIFSVQVKGDPELKLNLLKLLVAYLISRITLSDSFIIWYC